jgi:hypothetical protein
MAENAFKKIRRENGVDQAPAPKAEVKQAPKQAPKQADKPAGQ